MYNIYITLCFCIYQKVSLEFHVVLSICPPHVDSCWNEHDKTNMLWFCFRLVLQYKIICDNCLFLLQNVSLLVSILGLLGPDVPLGMGWDTSSITWWIYYTYKLNYLPIIGHSHWWLRANWYHHLDHLAEPVAAVPAQPANLALDYLW